MRGTPFLDRVRALQWIIAASKGAVRTEGTKTMQQKSSSSESESSSKASRTNSSGSIQSVGTETAETGSRGKTYVADEVVTTIASIAAEQVDGVHRLGDTGIKGMIGRIGRNSGVGSEVGMKQAAISLDVVIEYGYRLGEVATELRQRVIEAVEHMADREVVAVDINIVDVYVPEQPIQRASRILE